MAAVRTGIGSGNRRSGRRMLTIRSSITLGICGRIRSDSAAAKIAPWKVGLISATRRCRPSVARSSSIGPRGSPRRDTAMWSQAAKRSALISSSNNG